MKDLYKKYGLHELTSNRDMIEAELEKLNAQDRQAGEYILLHEQRKSVYDRTFCNVKLIAQLRSELGLTDTAYWPRQQFSDFESSDESGCADATSSADYAAPNPRSSDNEVNWVAKFLGLVVFFVALFVIFYDDELTTSTPPGSIQHRTSMYVTSDALNLHETPGNGSRVLDTLNKYQTLYVDPANDTGNWLLVETSNGLKGYVSRKYLARGNGDSAMISDCRQQGVFRPANGHVFMQQYTGPNRLVINNNPFSDAIVKLKKTDGETILAFYVRSGQSAKITNVPEGYFQLFYTTGSEYSPGCGRFLTNMRTSRDPQVIPYITEQRGNTTTHAVKIYTLQ